MSYHLFIRTEDSVHYNQFTYEYELVDYLVEYGYDLNEYKSIFPKDVNMDDFPPFSYLLIKGNTVFPKPEQVVTRWKFDCNQGIND